MTRIIATRLTYPKFNKLLEWSKTNSSILQTVSRAELANTASKELGFPIAASSFALISEAMSITIGRRVVKKKKQTLSKTDQLEKDVKVLANVLKMNLEHNGGSSEWLDEIIARRGDQP